MVSIRAFQVVNNICEFVGPIVTSLSKRGMVCFLQLSINYFLKYVFDDLYSFGSVDISTEDRWGDRGRHRGSHEGFFGEIRQSYS